MTVFKYRGEIFKNGKNKVLRPVADVWIKTKSNLWLEFHPYIDSGADLTMIPLSLGRLIGFELDKSKIEEIGGIRGSVPVIHVQNKIKIGNKEINTHIAWCLIEEVPPLLGRMDIFDTFDITFKQTKKQIIFSPLPH